MDLDEVVEQLSSRIRGEITDNASIQTLLYRFFELAAEEGARRAQENDDLGD